MVATSGRRPHRSERTGSYIDALRKAIHAEEAKFRTTAQKLRLNGLLTQEEAAIVRPQLSVVVKDVRSPVFDGHRAQRPSPLPEWSPEDPRTTIHYDGHP